jgi:hypothetical protein
VSQDKRHGVLVLATREDDIAWSAHISTTRWTAITAQKPDCSTLFEIRIQNLLAWLV